MYPWHPSQYIHLPHPLTPRKSLLTDGRSHFSQYIYLPPPLSLHASRPLVSRPLVTRSVPTCPTDIPSRATCPDIFNCPFSVDASHSRVPSTRHAIRPDIPETFPPMSPVPIYPLAVSLLTPASSSHSPCPVHASCEPSRHTRTTFPPVSLLDILARLTRLVPTVPHSLYPSLPPCPPLTSPEIQPPFVPASSFSARGPFVRPS